MFNRMAALAAFLFIAAGVPAAFAQSVDLTETVPDESLLGEQFCFTTDITNTGDPGFGPYLRLVLPPHLILDSADVFDDGTAEFIGIFQVDPEDPGAPETDLNDPRINQSVTGPVGYSYYNLVLPVGGFVDGGPPLPIELCLTIDPAATMGQPLPIWLTPVYEFGDTPTGSNGPIVGDPVEQTVSPTVLLMEKTDTAPESERPPGPSWPYTYSVRVDIANTATINPLTISDVLPNELQYLAGSVNIAGGSSCSATQEPSSSVPGGNLEVVCTGNTVGTGADDDVVVTYQGYLVDILDETFCETAPIVNEAWVEATYIDQGSVSIPLPQSDDDNMMTAKHVAIQKSAGPEQIVPGNQINYSYAIQVTDYGNVSALVITDVLDDGIEFDAGSVSFTVDGGASIPVTPTVTVVNDTTVVMDLLAAWQAATGQTQFDAGSAISLSYQADVRQTYRADGQPPVLAADPLGNSVVADYDLVEGASACSDGSAAMVRVAPVTIEKSVVNPQPHYEAGDVVVFRLRMDVPSGDSRGIQFVDFLPLPVLKAGDVNLAFSADPTDCANGSAGICLGPNDTMGLTPDDIAASIAQNSITIDWPDLDTTSDQVIEVDLHATVTNDPFADGLFLTNIFQAHTENTPGDVAAGIGPVRIRVGAPALELTKGVIATSGEGVIDPPAGSEFPENGNIAEVEAGDTVTFRLTLENMGRAPAYEVTLFDELPAGLTACSVDDVSNSSGDPLAYSGDLFDENNPLTLDSPLPGLAVPPTGTHIAFIDFTCTVAVGVQPEDAFTNFALGAYTSDPGGPEFPPIDDEADVGVASVDLEKSLVASSEDHTSDTANPPRLAIGEIARYRLVTRIPRSTMPGFTIEDNLPTGLQFLDDGTATLGFVSASGANIASSALSGAGLNIAGTSPDVAPSFVIPAAAISPASFGSGTSPVFSLGEIVNSESGDDDEWIVLEFNALVLNIPANSAGTDSINTFQVRVDGSQLGDNSNSHVVRLVEPEVSITKSADPVSGEAGTVIEYQLDVQVSSGANTADAFDVVVADTLPAAAVLDAGSVAVTSLNNCGSPAVNDISSGNTVEVDFDALPTGCSLSIVYEATLAYTLSPGSVVTNTANLGWSSLPGSGSATNPTGSTTPGNSGETDGEREYNSSDSAQVGVVDVASNKLLFATSEAHTTGSNLAIGEVATYRLAVDLPQGTSPDFAIIDQLDAGLAYRPGSARLAFVGNDGGIVSGDSGIGSAPQIVGNSPNITPSFVLPSANISISGTELRFDLGSLNNQDDDADSEYVVIVFDALLRNIASNQAGAVRNNRFTVEIDGEQNGPASNILPVSVVEPSLDSLSKTADPDAGEAGDEIEFTVAFTMSDGPASSEAFELELEDDLPAQMALDLDSVNVQYSGCVPTPAHVDNSSGNQVALEFDQVPTGCTVEVSYTAELLLAVNPGQPLENTANLNWTSLPGSGVATPGDPGDGDGKRTGDGGVNDYFDSATADVDIEAVVLTKAAVSGNEPSTDLPNAAIGETITYELIVTMPLGTTPSVTLRDQVPHDGIGIMELLGAEVTSVGSNLVVADPSGNPIFLNLRLSNSLDDTVDFDFGQVINDPDTHTGTSEESQIVIEVTARVNNEGVNANGDVLTNTATVQFGPDLSTSASADITLVEPRLDISKEGNITSGEAGDLVEFTVIIDHGGSSTADAQNVNFFDDLPAAQLVYQPGTLSVTGYTTGMTTNLADGIMRVRWDEIPQGETATITYRAVLDDDVETGTTITNTGEVTWHTMATEDGQTRGYGTQDDHDIVISEPGVDKSVYATSEPSTSDPELTIGEQVTWRINVSFPQGITPNAVFTDTLPQSNDFIYVSSRIVSIGSNLGTTGIAVNDPGVHDAGNRTVSWELGTVNNPPTTGPGENQQMVFEVIAVVADAPANAGGDSATNTASLDADTLDDPIVDTDTVGLVEPRLNVDKSVADPSSGIVNAGDMVTFELAINHSGQSSADAFSLIFEDTLPADLAWLGVANVSDDCVSTLSVDDSAAPVIVFELDELTLAEGGCTISYQADVLISAEAGASYTNTVAGQYDSTPAYTAGETRRRNPSSSATVTMEAPALVKVSLETDLADTESEQHDPLLFDLAIGELITWRIDVIVPPGTTSNAVVGDFLPDDVATGLVDGVASQVILPPGGQLTISNPIGDVDEMVDVNGDGYIDTVTFDFGDITVQPGATVEQRTITLRVTGRVVDVPGNVDGLVLTNYAEFDFLGNPDDPLWDEAYIDVVEPDLELGKTMTQQGNGAVRIALTVENTGTGPAYMLSVSDVLSDVDWDLGSFSQVSVPSGYSLGSTVSGGELIVEFSSADDSTALMPGVSRSALFDITLANNPPLPAPDGNNPVVNEADLDSGCSYPAACDQTDPDDNIGRPVDPDDDSATLGFPLLELDKSVALLTDADGSGDISPGDVLRYTLVLENTGFNVATDVFISDVPDANSPLVIGSVTTGQGTVTLGNNAGDSTVEVNVGTLAAGTSVTVTYDVTIVNPFPAGVEDISNLAVASSHELPDVDDEEETPVNAVPDLELTKDDGGVTAVPGGTVVYTLSYANVGNQNATGVFLTDTVPDYTSFNNAASTVGWVCAPDAGAGSVCTLEIGNLAVGDSGSVQFAVDLDNPLPLGVDEIDNLAVVSDDGSNSPQPITDDDDETTPINTDPDLVISKTLIDADPDPAVVGGVLTYQIVADNIGNMTLTNVVISDPLVDPINQTSDCVWDGAAGTLLMGESVTCTVEYTVTQGDMDNGQIVNTATADSDQTEPVDDNETVILDQDPALVLVKSASPTSYTDVGDVIEYSFQVENIGNVTLTGVEVDDSMLGGSIACSPATLLPGEIASCGPVPYSVVQADLNAGQIINTADASAFDPANDPVQSPPDTETVTGPAADPELALIKSATPGSYADVGDTIEYSFEVSNIGNVTLGNIEVDDPMLGGVIACVPATIDPGETATCGPVSYVVTQDDIDAGEITNVAEASGVDPNDTPVSDEDDETVDGPMADPAIELVKEITSGSPYADVGDVIEYELVATNTGNVTLFDVEISDPDATMGACSPVQPAELAPGDELTCQASYTVTQADIDNGGFTNVAQVDAIDPNDDPVSDNDEATAIGPDPDPAIELVKTVTSGSPYADVGDLIEFELVATNTGNVTLFDVAISDPQATIGTCTPAQPAELAPGDEMTCQASYIVTQADIDNGEFINLATAEGTDPNDDPVEDDDSVTVPGPAADPAIALVKTITAGAPFENVDDEISYELVATNMGNVTLFNVEISDPDAVFGVCMPAQPATLAPGETLTCAASHTVTQLDVDAGEYTNVAQVIGEDPGGTVVDDDDEATATGPDAEPAIDVLKTAVSGVPYADVGDVVGYEITATNTGNVTLFDVVIDDPQAVIGTCTPAQPASLFPGESLVCEASYEVTQADIDNGEFINLAEATGDDPNDTPVVDDDEETVEGPDADPSIELVKTITSGSPYTAVDDVIEYELVATNTGNVTLFEVEISDLDATIGTCAPAQPAELAPGDELTCQASYTVTQADIDNGGFTNVAQVDAIDPNDDPVSDNDQATAIGPDPDPAIELVKTVTSGSPYADVGDLIEFELVATNTGNVTLFDVAISDPQATIGTCTPAQPAELAPGDEMTCQASYIVTQADIDNGEFINLATAEGTDPNDDPVEDDDSVTVPGPTADPALEVVKSAVSGVPYANVGDVIGYEITATNAGNVTLFNVEISDPQADIESCEPDQPATLSPGASLVCQASYTVAQDDIDNGEFTNLASAQGVDPNDDPVFEEDDETVEGPPADPAIELVKTVSSGSPYSEVGDVIGYQLVATNTGNVTLFDVLISDPQADIDGCEPDQPTTLAPGEELICQASYTVTQVEIDAAEFVNTASVQGEDPTGTEVSDTDQASAVSAPAQPAIELVKQADTAGPVWVGEEINYTLTATNTGNVTLDDVEVVDELIELSCTPAQPASLAPGEAMACTGTYTVREADLGPPVLNQASVIGYPPVDDPVISDDEVRVTTRPPLPVPAIGLPGLLLMIMLFGLMGLRSRRGESLGRNS